MYGFVDFGELLWFTGNCMNSCVNGYQKLRSKSRHSFFLPVKCFSQFRFGFRAYDPIRVSWLASDSLPHFRPR